VVAPCRRGVEPRQADGWLAARSENRSVSSGVKQRYSFPICRRHNYSFCYATAITPFVEQAVIARGCVQPVGLS
jgi:hypothetical protein